MASIIHKDSKDCALTVLDNFEIPPTSTQVEQTTTTSYQPISTISDNQIIEFYIRGPARDYLALLYAMLEVTCHITKADGTAITDEDKVGPVNSFIHSLFHQVDIFLNDTLVHSSNNMYPYRAYFEQLFGYGKEHLHSQGSTGLFRMDDADKMESLYLGTNKGNSGLEWRSTFAKGSGKIEMIAPIYSDIFNQARYLPNNVSIKIRLVRSRPEFCLMAAANKVYKVIIDNATLHMTTAKLSPSVQIAHETILRNNTMKFPIQRGVTKVFGISSGMSSVNKDNLVLGQMPTRIIVGLVTQEAMNGKFEKNPFNFQHFDLNHIQLFVDSEPVPAKPLTPNFNTGEYIRAYQSLFTGSNTWRADKTIPISREDYSKGYTLYMFDLTQDKTGCPEMFNLIKSGNLRIDLKFGTQLTTAVNCVMHMTFDSMIEIDSARRLSFNYPT